MQIYIKNLKEREVKEMMDSNFPSLADISAVTKNDEFGGGMWVWLLIILFFIGGGNLWSNNAQQYATSTEVQNGFNNQNMNARFDTLAQNQNAYAMDNANLINQNRYDTAQLVNGVNTNMLQSTANITSSMNAGFDNLTMQINNLAHQIEQCGCNLKTQMLQDKYDQAQNQLNLAEIASSNAVQTNNLLGNLGRWVANPPYPIYYGQYGTTVS